MDANELYRFIFETPAGVGVLFAIAVVVSVLASIVMERRTRKIYTNHEKSEDDWSFFDDDEDEPDDGEGKSA